mmetsp:Transcript_31578/g.66407  ORF Transcript_31578/g.66407 Transcript_31578/m.66407 type:complete len:93 (+) Transcript_31578:717-995(+)
MGGGIETLRLVSARFDLQLVIKNQTLQELSDNMDFAEFLVKSQGGCYHELRLGRNKNIKVKGWMGVSQNILGSKARLDVHTLPSLPNQTVFG